MMTHTVKVQSSAHKTLIKNSAAQNKMIMDRSPFRSNVLLYRLWGFGVLGSLCELPRRPGHATYPAPAPSEAVAPAARPPAPAQHAETPARAPRRLAVRCRTRQWAAAVRRRAGQRRQPRGVPEQVLNHALGMWPSAPQQRSRSAVMAGLTEHVELSNSITAPIRGWRSWNAVFIAVGETVILLAPPLQLY